MNARDKTRGTEYTQSHLSSSVRLPDTLHCANISIISEASCNKDYPGRVLPTMVCAGVEGGGTDSCEVRDKRGLWVKEGLGCVLAWFAVAVIKYSDQKQLGEGGVYLAYSLQVTTEGSQGRNASVNLKQKPWTLLLSTLALSLSLPSLSLSYNWFFFLFVCLCITCVSCTQRPEDSLGIEITEGC